MKKSFALDLKGLHLEKVNWKKVAIVVSSLWIVAQLVLIAWFWDIEQRGDFGVYVGNALDFYNRGSWYPDQTSIHDSFIWAQGLINWFILQLKIFGTLKLNFFFNLLMNVGILYNVWYLTDRFFSRRIAYIAVILFCLLNSNVMVILPAATEVPFVFLCLTAFSLCVSGGAGKLLLAGVLLALGNWIRPLVVIFLPAILLMMFLEKRKVAHYAALLVPVVGLCLLFGGMAKKRCGYFVFQSTTSGINLVMTANDKADGLVTYGPTNFFLDTTNICYIKDAERLTFAEKDSIWTARGIGWIKEHPARYAGLYVKKLGLLHMGDTWAQRLIIHGKGFVYRMRHGEIRKEDMLKEIFLLSIPGTYYVVCLFFLIALVRYRKMILTRKGLVLLVWLVGTLVTCLFPASQRYHYPFIFAVIIWAAYGIDSFLQSRRAEPENRENA